MNTTFAQILGESYKQESRRLDRKLAVLMPDEYQLTEDMEHALSAGTYQFPDVLEMKTDKRVLTRTQDYFSAKAHVRRTPLYFHRHNFVELLYMYRGRCRQFIENLGTCIMLQEGDIFLLNKNVTHALLQEEESAVLIKVIIPGGMVHSSLIRQLDGQQARFWVGAEEYYHYLHYSDAGTGGEKLFIERMMTEYYSENKCKEAAEAGWLQLLLVALSRREGRERRYKLGRSLSELGRVTQYIYDHSETVTLDELARAFAFSPSYLSRAIKERCGMNFSDLLRECRLEKAAAMLCGTKYSVEKIAEMVGYRSAASVYQGISEKFGMSPGEYRKHYCQINIEHTANK